MSNNIVAEDRGDFLERLLFIRDEASEQDLFENVHKAVDLYVHSHPGSPPFIEQTFRLALERRDVDYAQYIFLIFIPGVQALQDYLTQNIDAEKLDNFVVWLTDKRDSFIYGWGEGTDYTESVAEVNVQSCRDLVWRARSYYCTL